MSIDREEMERLVEAALQEDIGPGDVTTEAVIGPGVPAEGRIVSRGPGVVCGIPMAEAVFRALDPDAQIEADRSDGDAVEADGSILTVRGAARALLAGERTALNFLQRLSGIATLTRAYVDAVKGTGVDVYDTRKTTPLLRSLEKHAVRCGGGVNHRAGLHDQAMLKENHLAFLSAEEDAWREAVAAARRLAGFVVVEARTAEEGLRAARAGADCVLLDNLPIARLQEAISAIRSLPGVRPAIEVSGGVVLGTIREIAMAGPDRISVGALTHSAPPLDLSMTICPSTT